MPLQHHDDTMLKRMARRVTGDQTEAMIENMRKRIPNLAIRTTFITGFPGETDEQFETLAQFVEEQKFERVGVFTYSKEEGTPAVKLEGDLPEEVKEQRRERLMEIQQNIVFKRNESLIGQQCDVILDQLVPGETNAWMGRTIYDAPDVHGLVFVTGEDLSAGDIVPTEIVASQEYDLIGVAVGKPR